MSNSIQQVSRLSHLSEVLRRANSHYSQVALYIRASLHPTHHAWKRARRLGLHVNIDAARKLEQAQVSNIPLPVLDIEASPAPSRPSHPALRPVICQNIQFDEEESSLAMYSSIPLLTPPHEGSETFSEDSISPSLRSGSSSSCSSTSVSSGGPATPPDSFDRSVAIHIKRKFSELGEVDVCSVTIEKRPRYEGKGWIFPSKRPARNH